MSYNLISLTTSALSKNNIKSICKLKDKEWRFGYKSQYEWFKSNVKKKDIHNLFFIKSRLVGYTLLRLRSCKISNTKKNLKYLLFDTLIIDSKYRKKKHSNILMHFNNTIIKQKKCFSFLICKQRLVSFYKKYGWIKLNTKNISVENRSFLRNCLVYNGKEIKKKIIYFFTNK